MLIFILENDENHPSTCIVRMNFGEIMFLKQVFYISGCETSPRYVPDRFCDIYNTHKFNVKLLS